MRSFYFPDPLPEVGAVVPLTDELAKHLLRVLRLAPGERIELFNGSGRVVEAVLLDDTRVTVETVRDCPAPACELTLIQGLPKGEKVELILQKGTEVGVNRFFLAGMQRSVGLLKSERREKRLQRWNRVIQEAARQCRQFHLPQLFICSTLADALAQVDADLKLLLWEEGRVSLPEVVPQYLPQRIAVLVGPEGGVSETEVAMAQAEGFQPIGLGPRILRTETAGLAVMAILQYLYGDLTNVSRFERTAVQGKEKS